MEPSGLTDLKPPIGSLETCADTGERSGKINPEASANFRNSIISPPEYMRQAFIRPISRAFNMSCPPSCTWRRKGAVQVGTRCGIIKAIDLSST